MALAKPLGTRGPGAKGSKGQKAGAYVAVAAGIFLCRVGQGPAKSVENPARGCGSGCCRRGAHHLYCQIALPGLGVPLLLLVPALAPQEGPFERLDSDRQGLHPARASQPLDRLLGTWP